MVGREFVLSLHLYKIFEFEDQLNVAMTDYNPFNVSNTMIRCRVQLTI